MDQKKLREWVEKKLDQGVSRDRIKKSLENTGHDPSIVDEVGDPFSSGQDQDEPDMDFSGSSAREPASGTDHSSPDLDSDSGTDFDISGRESYDGEEGGDGKGFSPLDMPETPDLSLPHIPVKAAAVILVVIIAFGGYLLLPQGAVPAIPSDDLNISVPDIQVPEVSLPRISLSDDGGNERTPAEVEDAECDVGLRINSAHKTGDGTEAEIVVTRGITDLTVEIHRSRILIDSFSARMSGQGTIRVPETGDKIVIYPEGCDTPRKSARIS